MQYVYQTRDSTACYASKSKSISVDWSVARTASSVAVLLVFVTLIVDGMATNYFAEADSNCKCAVESGRWPSVCLSVSLRESCPFRLLLRMGFRRPPDRFTALPSVSVVYFAISAALGFVDRRNTPPASPQSKLYIAACLHGHARATRLKRDGKCANKTLLPPVKRMLPYYLLCHFSFIPQQAFTTCTPIAPAALEIIFYVKMMIKQIRTIFDV